MEVDRQQQLREVREAIDAGRITIEYLNQAMQELDSAAGFGIADLLGLDFIGEIGKHMKIESARAKLQQAQQQAESFRSELVDLRGMVCQSVDIDDLWTFMDFFLDGFIMDFLMQDKIEKAKRQVQDCITQINGVMGELYQLESRLMDL